MSKKEKEKEKEKEKKPKPDAAEYVLNLINKNANLSDIVSAAVTRRVMTKNELPVNSDTASKLMQGFSGAVTKTVGVGVVDVVRQKATALAHNGNS